MFTAIISAISIFFSSLPKAVENYIELKKTEHETRIAIEKQRIELSSTLAQLEQEKAIESLKSTSRGFKYFTFFMWFGPFMISTVAPGYGTLIFSNLAQLPEWYVQSCMVLMFAVWGISVSAPAISNIFSGLSSFMNERQRVKINRKVIFDVVKALREKPYTEQEVALLDKTIDNAMGSK